MEKIKINGRIYSSLAEVDQAVDQEIYDFLNEWFSDTVEIIGRTSGSTGKPREIRLQKKDMKASAHITNEFLHITSDSTLLLCLSVSYIAGKMMIVRALEANAMLFILPPSSYPLGVLEIPVDLAAMVPMQVAETIARPEGISKLSLIRQLLIGGAPLSDPLEKQLSQLPTVCYVTYGMTETVSHVALRRLNVDQEYHRLGNVYFSVDNRGCLIIHAPHLCEQEFITNDVVQLISPTCFKWLGRYDNVINSGGIKYFPEVIEARLDSFINQRFFITSFPDERLGEKVVLVIEDTPWETKAIKECYTKIRQALARYEVPREILFIEHFHETFSGKVIRDAQGAIPVQVYDAEKKQIW